MGVYGCVHSSLTRRPAQSDSLVQPLLRGIRLEKGNRPASQLRYIHTYTYRCSPITAGPHLLFLSAFSVDADGVRFTLHRSVRSTERLNSIAVLESQPVRRRCCYIVTPHCWLASAGDTCCPVRPRTRHPRFSAELKSISLVGLLRRRRSTTYRLTAPSASPSYRSKMGRVVTVLRRRAFFSSLSMLPY